MQPSHNYKRPLLVTVALLRSIFPIFVKKNNPAKTLLKISWLVSLWMSASIHVILHYIQTHILLLITYRIISSNRMRAPRVTYLCSRICSRILSDSNTEKIRLETKKKSKKFKRNNEILRLRRALSSIIFVKSWSAWSLCAACPPRVPLPAHGYPCPPLP